MLEKHGLGIVPYMYALMTLEMALRECHLACHCPYIRRVFSVLEEEHQWRLRIAENGSWNLGLTIDLMPLLSTYVT